MPHHAVLGPVLLFVLLLVLASVVGGLGAARRGLGRDQALGFGAVLFLAQLAIFVLLAGVGLPGTAAQGAALALGVLGALPQDGPAER
jgi:hypothetical protein